MFAIQVLVNGVQYFYGEDEGYYEVFTKEITDQTLVFDSENYANAYAGAVEYVNTDVSSANSVHINKAQYAKGKKDNFGLGIPKDCDTAFSDYYDEEDDD